MTRIVRLVSAIVCLIAPSLATDAHEGHAPLPVRGVLVDVAKGTIVMSREAHDSLGVQTAVVKESALEETALAAATLVSPWRKRHFVSSRLPGRVARLHVVTGARVSIGQLLAEIASPELESLLLEIRTAQNDFSLSSKQVSRLLPLAEGNAVPRRDLIEAQSVDEQNRNALTIAREKLRGLGFDDASLDALANLKQQQNRNLSIFSPSNGVVSHTDLAVGKVVAADEHLFEVSDLSQLWVKIGVLERDLRRIAPGQKLDLNLSAFPNESLRLNVAAKGGAVDPVTHLGTVWADLENPSGEPRYLPGMYGLARIVTSPGTKLPAIPSAALLGNGAERYVLVETAASMKGFEYSRQNVAVAARNASQAQVLGGAFPGDRVVTVGAQALSSFFVLGVLRLSPEGIKNIGLQVEAAKRRTIERVLEFDGQIDLAPDRRASVSAQLPGTVHGVHVSRGQNVKAGDVLAEVASLTLQDTQFEMIQADLAVQLHDGTLKRWRGLGDDPRLIPQRRQWETETLLQAAVNRRESARRRLHAVGLSVAETEDVLRTRRPRESLPIRSPIDGAVVRFNKVLGETVSEDQSLIDVHDLSRPWVVGYLSERDAPLISLQTPVRLRLSSDAGFAASGKIARTARSVGADDRTLMVWIDFDEPPRQTLEQNLLVKIAATLDAGQPALAVPRSAIVHDGTRTYAFVENSDGLLDRRFVELGRVDDRYVEVLKGIVQGERVVVQGAAELQTTFANVR